MSDEVDLEAVLTRLDAAASLDTLSGTHKKQAQTLAHRLRIGARIFVLGPQDAGKSQLCSALFRIAPDDLPAGASTVFHAGEANSDDTLNALNLGQFREKTISSHNLSHVQIIDVGGEPMATPYSDRLTGILSQADIVLWCSQSYAPEEASIWSCGPDDLKDRSFLVLTKADVLAEQGLLNERVAEMQAIAAEEFFRLHPVSTKSIARTLHMGQSVSDAQYAASGVEALEAALSHLTRTGQSADVDSALLFLERHNVPAEVTDSPKHVSSKPVDAGTKVAVEQPSSVSIYRTAYKSIMERAFDLAEVTFDVVDGDMEEVLDVCSSIAEELTDLLSDADATSDVEKEWRSALEEAVDKVTLMGMENDTRSAADGVTILLQLRRDLAQKVADVPTRIAA